MILTGFTGTAWAQGSIPFPSGRLSFRTPTPTPPPAEVRSVIDSFFGMIKSGECQKAYEMLLSGTRLKENKENAQTLVVKTEQALNVYGKPTTQELYDQKLVGERLMATTYLTHHPLQPLRWRFVFYRADKNWVLIDVRVDDVLEDLMQSS